MTDYHPPLIWIADTNLVSISEIKTISDSNPSGTILHTGNIYGISNDSIVGKYVMKGEINNINLRDYYGTLYYLYGQKDYNDRHVETKNHGENVVYLPIRSYVKIGPTTALIGIETKNNSDKLLEKKLNNINNNIIQNIIITIDLNPFVELNNDERINNNNKILYNENNTTDNMLRCEIRNYQVLLTHKPKKPNQQEIDFILNNISNVIKIYATKNLNIMINILCGSTANKYFNEKISENIMIHFTTSFHKEKKILFVVPEPFDILETNPRLSPYNKIIFLDIDGVLANSGIDYHIDVDLVCSNDFPYPEFNVNSARLQRNTVVNFWYKEAVDILTKMCNKDANIGIVITSFWRNKYTFEELRYFFGIHNLGNKIIGTTPQCGWGYERGKEIALYLEKFDNINNFVIIDDRDDGISELFPDNFAKVFGNHLGINELSKIEQCLFPN